MLLHCLNIQWTVMFRREMLIPNLIRGLQIIDNTTNSDYFFLIAWLWACNLFTLLHDCEHATYLFTSSFPLWNLRVYIYTSYLLVLLIWQQQPSSPRPSKIPQRVRDERSGKSDKSQDSFLEKLNSSKEQNPLSDSRRDKGGRT